MRIIERNQKGLEIEKVCPSCGSKFAFEYSDMFWYTDISGVRCPAVNCPVCHYGIDLEGSKLPPKTYSIDDTNKNTHR